MDEIEIRFGFDPNTSAALFSIRDDPVAMSLWAMWKQNHIVSEMFIRDVQIIVHRVRGSKRKYAEYLDLCFPSNGYDFSQSDVREFVPRWHDVLIGKTKLFFVVAGQRREVTGADIWKPTENSQ